MPHVELPQTEFKLVILGDTHIGKTSLVLRFTEGYYRHTSQRYSPTIGAFFLTKHIKTSSGGIAKVQIWDTAGQVQFRPMAPMYWKNGGASAILVCYDVGNKGSWDVACEWLKELRKDGSVVGRNIVLCLVACKSDLWDEVEAMEEEGGVVTSVRNGVEEYGDNDDDNDVGEQYGGQNEGEETKERARLLRENMVSMADVEQVLQSLNQSSQISNVHALSNGNIGIGNGSKTSPLSSNQQRQLQQQQQQQQQFLTPQQHASALDTNHIHYSNDPLMSNTNENDIHHGQILHIHTSARKDHNVDSLFQKVAEEVLFVREQERTLWMNHGIKYKHYSTLNATDMVGIGAGMVGGSSSGGSPTSRTMNHRGNSSNSSTPAGNHHHSMYSTPEYNKENESLSTANPPPPSQSQGSPTMTSSSISTAIKTPSKNIKNLTIDTTTTSSTTAHSTNLQNNYSNHYYDEQKHDVQKMKQNGDNNTSRSLGSSGASTPVGVGSGGNSGLCYAGCSSSADDDSAYCVIS